MTEQGLQASEKLKQILTSTPILAFPHIPKDTEFTSVTDTSHLAVGMALLQDQGHGLKPLAFEACKQTYHKVNYPVQ